MASFWSFEPAYPKPLLAADYNGPEPYATDFTGDLNADTGQIATLEGPYLMDEPALLPTVASGSAKIRPAAASGGYAHRPGKFGKGIQIAKAATNLCTNPSAETDTTNLVAIGAGTTVTRISTDAYIGTYCVEVAAADVASAGLRINSSSRIAVTGGVTYSFSIRLKRVSSASNTVTLGIAWFDAGAAQVGSATIAATLTTDWASYSVAGAAPATAVTCYLYVARNTSGAHTYRSDAMLFEAGSRPTPYFDGSLGAGHSWSGTAHASTSSRTATVLSYLNVLQSAAGTISLWWIPSSDSYATDRYLIDDGALTLYHKAVDGKLYFNISADLSGAVTLTANAANHIAVTWGAAGKAIYLNGVLLASTTSVETFTPGARLYVGCSTAGATQADGVVDSLRILDYQMTATQVADLYALPVELASGDVFDLSSLSIYVQGMSGAGMPQMTVIADELALQDGQQHKRQIARPRSIQLVCEAPGTTYQNWHALRRALISKISRDQNRDAPFRLVYSGAANPYWIDCRYDAGMEMSPPEGFEEIFPLRLIAADPFWRGSHRRIAMLTSEAQTQGYIAMRNQDGTWSTMAGGMNAATPRDLVRLPDGAIVAGGDFTSPGHGIAKWDGGWTDLEPTCNGIVHCLAVGPSGTLYAGGTFTVPQTRIMSYNGSAWSAMGAGADDTVYALCVGHDGKVYMGGKFTSPYSNIAVWSGAAWAAVSTFWNSNNVRALAVAKNGNIIAGGTGGKVARWNGSSWTQLGSAFTGGTAIIYALAVMPNGDIIAAGDFTSPGAYIARWNGSAWYAMGSGADDVVHELCALPDGTLLAGGDFATMGGIALADALAAWNGAWWPYPVKFPGTTSIGSILYADGRLIFGHDTTGAATVTGATAITNNGNTAAYPKVVLTGPGNFKALQNVTNGEAIYFDLTLQSGESATLDLANRTIVTFISTARGNIMNSILPGSGLSTWRLDPGLNNVHVLALSTDANTKVVVSFDERHWSCD